MGITSENVAEKYGITRSQQITPVTTTCSTADGRDEQVTVTKDEGVRAGTTVEGLAKLKPSFKPNGTTTAGRVPNSVIHRITPRLGSSGNSSQVSDGAAACLVTTRRVAEQLKLPILGSFVSYAVGPAVAIPAALKKAGLTIDQIDVFELNEARCTAKPRLKFQATKSTRPVRRLGILSGLPSMHVGGAIALGHPLGCTGARQIATLLHGLHRTNQTYGVVSMCIGTGMGAAAVFKRE
ncbi:hypothetical protein DYB32_007252 [Aphanomyces invadans]|uniref:acetyl-CoA C-acyltransferase n=1 Tax=Aphanomyces invadans TaxID=157072 RepID=A0A3R6WIA3_9STRA|nr:hypothetical protein DYB32_007252 [Aphanomyces invadans]